MIHHRAGSDRATMLAARSYGVLVGRIVDGSFDAAGKSPHYEVHVVADGDYRLAINARSVDGSEVLVHQDLAYTNPTKRDLSALAAGPAGFTALQTGPGGAGLDYLRDGLYPLSDVTMIAPDGDVSLATLLDAQIARAKADPGAVAITFGDMFADPGADPTFGFSPEQGVHDIHMMQGNGGDFAADNRINGDGAFFIRFSDGTTTAVFIRFATQALQTDDSGNVNDK